MWSGRWWIEFEFQVNCILLDNVRKLTYLDFKVWHYGNKKCKNRILIHDSDWVNLPSTLLFTKQSKLCSSNTVLVRTGWPSKCELIHDSHFTNQVNQIGSINRSKQNDVVTSTVLGWSKLKFVFICASLEFFFWKGLFSSLLHIGFSKISKRGV